MDFSTPIAKQLWNIVTQIMTKECKEVSGYLNPRLYAAELFSKAHDLALYSEEECGAPLTKGHLVFEDLHSKSNKAKVVVFTLKVKLESTDICSEFSAQCLLLNVAHVLDDVNDKISLVNNSQDCLSTDQEQLLSKTMNC